MTVRNETNVNIDCNTSSIDVKQRVEVWAETVRSAFGSVNVKTERHGDNLYGHLKSAQRDMLRFNSLRYRGQSHHRTPADIARLKNEYITLTQPDLGKLNVDYGSTQRVLEPGNIYLFNHAVPYYATPQADYGTTSIAFPASALRQRGIKIQPLLMLPASSPQGSVVLTMADQLTASYLQWSDREFSVLTEQFLDLVALFFFNPGLTHSQDESSVRSAHLQRAIAFIRANFGEADLSPAKIAQACGISVSYLHNIFGATDASVETTVINARLEHSRKLLTTPQTMHLPIGMIAYMSGFSHPAHFSRVFRQKFGCTPRELRSTAKPNAK
jgi:AraC-like DNA-binding protein